MASATGGVSGVAQPRKRLRAAEESLNSRYRFLKHDSRVRTSDFRAYSIQDAGILMKKGRGRGRGQAVGHRNGSSVQTVTQIQCPGDGITRQDEAFDGKKTRPSRLKSAEELHFEALQDYCPSYDDDGGHQYDDGCGVGVAAEVSALDSLQSPGHLDASMMDGWSKSSKRMHLDACGYLFSSNGDVDARSTSVKGTKHLDVYGDVSSSYGDVGAAQVQANGSKAVMVKTLGHSMRAEPTKHSQLDGAGPMGISQSVTTDAEPIHRVERRKTAQSDTIRSQAEHIGKVHVCTKKTVQAGSSEALHLQSQLDKAEDLQLDSIENEQPLTKVQDNNLEEEVTKSEASGDLSQEQKIRMELNKAAALARRNMRMCEDNVADAQAQGLLFPKFESLLVEKSWVEVLGGEFQKPYMERLHQFVSQEAAGRIPIYPPPAKLFNAFNSCPFDKVKVVIIGQDPYHGPCQAMGLCFSVEKGTKIPSSLANIFLEIESDLQCDFPSHGNLEKWAHQGVLLLNTVLTVRDHHANSHAKKGWEPFTDAAIRALAQERSGVVFLLWGISAQEKLRLINRTSHHVLKAFHPSGMSARKGFFKCRHFSKTNDILVDQGLLPIDWQL